MEESIEYLFNSSGFWIAFKKGKYVFNKSCEWIGWPAWGGHHVANSEGQYLGSIVPDENGHSRFYYFLNTPSQEHPGYPGYPKTPEHPGHPRFIGPSPLPPLAEDIEWEED